MTKLLYYFRTALHSDLTYDIIVSIGIFIFFIILAKVVSIILKRIIRPFVKRTESKLDDKLELLAEAYAKWLIVLFGGYFTVEIFKEGFSLISIDSHQTLISEYPILSQSAVVLEGILFIALVLVLMVLFMKTFKTMLEWYTEKMSANLNKDVSGSVLPLINKIARLLLALLALAVILSKFNINISAFVVSLGVGSLAIALAAQETISNMISGFIIMIDRPFRIGDRIRVGTEINGDVVGIGVRSTKILDFDRNLLILPNNDIVKSRITNFTYPDPTTRLVIEIPVPYSADVNQVRGILLELISKYDSINKDIPPEIWVTKLGESNIEVKLFVQIIDYHKMYETGHRLREEIHASFKEAGIPAPYPQRIVKIDKPD